MTEQSIPPNKELSALQVRRMLGLKLCYKCKTEKPCAEFSRDTSRCDGLQPRCKTCYSIYKKSRRKWPDRVPLTADEKIESKRRSGKKFRDANKEVGNERSRKWMRENKETFVPYQKQWRADNADQCRQVRSIWRQVNREHISQQDRQYRRDNSGRVSANTRARQCRKIRATPFWAELDAIREVYELSAALTRVSGIRYHVDHIVPLKSHLVCGLHCLANLQILPAAENIRKRNHHWPDMP
jgi:hypothetical protein